MRDHWHIDAIHAVTGAALIFLTAHAFRVAAGYAVTSNVPMIRKAGAVVGGFFSLPAVSR